MCSKLVCSTGATAVADGVYAIVVPDGSAAV